MEKMHFGSLEFCQEKKLTEKSVDAGDELDAAVLP